jgi:hypothetical protein
MVFRRFHRTAGPPLLLAFIGIIAAIVIPQFKQTPAHSLSFVGYADPANPTNAMFLAPEIQTDGTRFLNLTSADRFRTRLTYRDRAGQLLTKAVRHEIDRMPSGKERMLVPIPPETTEFSMTHFYRVRRGKASNVAAPGPPKVLFVLPWGKTEVFESGVIRIAETALSPE